MIPRRYDLQVHSTFSDGELTPVELAKLARRQKLAGIVITDHNTTAHFDTAAAAMKRSGLETVEGLEITTNFMDIKLHILGYALKFRRAELARGLRRTVRGYEQRLSGMLRRIAQQEKIRVSLRDLRSVKPHGELVKFDIHRYLVRRYPKRCVHWKNLLHTPALAVPYTATMLSPRQAIALLHRAGGIAVLSHPLDQKRAARRGDITRRMIRLIRRLKKDGLDGIEVYSSHHRPTQHRLLLKLSGSLGLLVTGGSDFHGPTWHRDIRLGSATVSEREYQRLKRHLTERKKTAEDSQS